MITPRLRSPIVLVHGLLGYDRLRFFGLTLASYFAGIPELLEGAGNRVLTASLHPVGSVAQRAAQLKAFLDREVGAEPVHLFAHSMGGLDSRYLISRLGMAERVLTLTTFGTPHRGSAFADWGISRFERLAKPLLDLLGMPHQAFYDLTTTSCRAFNEQVPDAPGVRYFSVAGRHEGSWMAPEWELSYRVVLREEGPNDGVVSLTSARYGESCEVWEGDHVSLINWLNPVHLLRGYAPVRMQGYNNLVRRLADEGY